MSLSLLGPSPPSLSQGSSPTSWRLCSRSGTASPSPARSATPWWVTCTGTRPAGAACCAQTRKRSHAPRSPGPEERGKTSVNLCLLVFWGVFSSSLMINGGEEFHLQRVFLSLLVVHRLWKSGWESGFNWWGNRSLRLSGRQPCTGGRRWRETEVWAVGRLPSEIVALYPRNAGIDVDV